MDADEMRELISRAVSKNRDDLVAAMQRMLSSPRSIEEPSPVSPYDTEWNSEGNEFFRPKFLWVKEAGHFDMTVRPAEYRADRLDLHSTPRKIMEYAVVVRRGGVFTEIPFPPPRESENGPHGARCWLNKPEWRRVEAVSVQKSGLYRFVRAFAEDYAPDDQRQSARFVETNRELFIDFFVQQMTLLHLLARNIARDLVEDVDEPIQFDLRLDGLKDRTPVLNRYDPFASMYIGLHSQDGIKDEFTWFLRTTRRPLEVEAVALARERCGEVFWTFGLRGDSILPIQRELLGHSEPAAMP